MIRKSILVTIIIGFVSCIVFIQTPKAQTGGFTVFVDSNFTKIFNVTGFFWVPDSTVTLEIDSGNDGTIDYTDSNTVQTDGSVNFSLDDVGDIAVDEGDLVRMFDGIPVNTHTHYVFFLTLESVDPAADMLMGQARAGNQILAKVFDPAFPDGPELWVTADGNDNWSADFLVQIDIVIGSVGFVYIQDNDFDKTQINWQAQETITQVTIDIKPGSYPNSINPMSKGKIPVAILSTDTFDATTVDPLSIAFGPIGATESHGRGHIEDVDGDSDADLVLHFQTQDTDIQCGDTSASLVGETFSGQAVEGSDSIKTVGCE
jgi:hypothetical protein